MKLVLRLGQESGLGLGLDSAQGRVKLGLRSRAEMDCCPFALGLLYHQMSGLDREKVNGSSFETCAAQAGDQHADYGDPGGR